MDYLLLPYRTKFAGERISFEEARRLYPSLRAIEAPDGFVSWLEKEPQSRRWIIPHTIHVGIVDEYLMFNELLCLTLMTQIFVAQYCVSEGVPSWIARFHGSIAFPPRSWLPSFSNTSTLSRDELLEKVKRSVR